MTVDPIIWEVTRWLLVGVFGLIFALLGLLYYKIDDVQKYASERFHNVNNKLHPIIAELQEQIEKKVSWEEFNSQINMLLRMIGKGK